MLILMLMLRRFVLTILVLMSMLMLMLMSQYEPALIITVKQYQKKVIYILRHDAKISENFFIVLG